MIRNRLKNNGTFRITIISLVSLISAHLMLTTLFPSVMINIFGLMITTFFIYQNTLHKKDIFSFVMVIYFCSTFPYLLTKGGAFNLVTLSSVLVFIVNNGRLPFEIKNQDKWLKLFLVLLVTSSILGWIINFVGTEVDLIYSILTFTGIILLLLISSRISISKERIKVFLQLNIILIVYATLVSINKYLRLINFESPMLPIYGTEVDYFEGGGLIGSSPLYGEHSLILAMLFAVFLIIDKKKLLTNGFVLLLALVLAYVNIFMSISRSVFLLSVIGLTLIIIFQNFIDRIKALKVLQQAFVIIIFTFTVLYIIQYFRLDYVFTRVEEISERNIYAGGITLERILDGRAFNREVAFDIGKERYKSKDTWLIGYGWGLTSNNRNAFYVNTSIKRGSAHSQVFAVLFIFGWLGFIAYWGLILRIIFKSFSFAENRKVEYYNRLLSLFFFIAFIMFLLNEIKADSISYPSYFSVTVIWMGLAFSNINTSKTLYKRIKEL